MQNAAYIACGGIAFISPESAIPLLVHHIHSVLDSSVFKWISSTDINIWKAPEGTLIVNGTFTFSTDY